MRGRGAGMTERRVEALCVRAFILRIHRYASMKTRQKSTGIE